MAGLRLITDATAEPVSLDEIKHHLRLSTSVIVEDSLLIEQIKTARHYAENYTKRSFAPQTWELTIDDLPGSTGAIEIPRPPLSTVDTDLTITYVKDSSSGGTTTISASAITVDHRSEPGRVYPSYGNEWPSVRSQRNAVTISFVTGYPLSSANALTTPGSIRTWIKMRVGMLYENRESVSVGSNNWIDEFSYSFIDGLLDPYTIQTVY